MRPAGDARGGSSRVARLTDMRAGSITKRESLPPPKAPIRTLPIEDTSRQSQTDQPSAGDFELKQAAEPDVGTETDPTEPRYAGSIAEPKTLSPPEAPVRTLPHEDTSGQSQAAQPSTRDSPKLKQAAEPGVGAKAERTEPRQTSETPTSALPTETASRKPLTDQLPAGDSPKLKQAAEPNVGTKTDPTEPRHTSETPTSAHPTETASKKPQTDRPPERLEEAVEGRNTDPEVPDDPPETRPENPPVECLLGVGLWLARMCRSLFVKRSGARPLGEEEMAGMDDVD
jgi:hypothetical protein